MEYIIQVENRWTGLFLAENDKTEYSTNKIARESCKTAKKSYKFVQISQNFLNILKFSKISKYLGNV